MEITVGTARESIITIIKAGLVPMVTSSPGLGKSDIINGIADAFNLKLIDMRLAQSDPVDLLGFPTSDGIRMGYAPPMHFPLKGIDKLPFHPVDPKKPKDPPKQYSGWLLFLDEFSSAPMAVQAAAYKLVLDRQVGVHDLHPKVITICAGNKTTDGAIVNRLSTAMQSRLVHLELAIDVPGWLEWAAVNKIDYRITGYVGHRPEVLHKFDPDHNDKTFACPRTWEFAHKLIKGKPDIEPLLPLLAGTISEGVAREFVSFATLTTKLPSIAEIVADPDGIVIDPEPAMLYASSHMIAAYLDSSNATPLVKFIDRLPVEFATITIKSAMKRDASLFNLPPIRTWANKLADEIFND